MLCCYLQTKTTSLEKRLNDYLSSLESWANKWRLSFAPHKCQYLVFSNQHRVDDFCLKIYGVELEHEECPKFLGIRFDGKLKFVNQIEHIVNSCSQRLGVLKALSNPFMALDTKTLVNVYKLIIRSLIDYSAFMVDLISKTELNRIQVIQNNALRIILKKSLIDKCSIDDLHSLCDIEMVESRMRKLNEKYFTKANANPLVEHLVEDYGQNFINSVQYNKYTILCGIEHFADMWD